MISTEILMMLAALALLAVLTNVVQLTALIASHGVGGMLRSRSDIPVPKPGFAGRVDREIENLKENLFFFIPLCLLTVLLDIPVTMSAKVKVFHVYTQE